MIVKHEPCQVFVLENRFFDQLSHPHDIALYAMIIRAEGIGYTDDMLMDWLNMSKEELDASFKKLIEIGFLKTHLSN